MHTIEETHMSVLKNSLTELESNYVYFAKFK